MDSVNSVYMHVNMCVYMCVCITIIIKKNKPLIGEIWEELEGRKMGKIIQINYSYMKFSKIKIQKFNNENRKR